MAAGTRIVPNIPWTHLRETLERFAEYFIQQARNNLGNNRSIATGTLYDTMNPIITIGEDFYKVEIEIQTYWDYVENGRSPGKFPPISKIKEWIQVKPVHPYPDARGKLPTIDQLTFLISRKIANEGIEPHPFFKPAKEDAIRYFEQAIELAIDEDVEAYVEEHVIRQALYNDLSMYL